MVETANPTAQVTADSPLADLPVGPPNAFGAEVWRDILGDIEWLVGLSNRDFVGLFGQMKPREALLKADNKTSAPVIVQGDVVTLLWQMLEGLLRSCRR